MNWLVMLSMETEKTEKQTNKNNKMTKKNLMNMEDVWLFKIGTKINDYLLYTIFILSA